MNEQLALSAVMFGIGAVVYLLRDTPNPYVGVRFGYTYLSKEAWKRANTFAGIYSMMAGLILLMITVIFNPSRMVFIALLLLSVAILVFQSYRIARETYEREDLKTPVKAIKPVKMVGIRPYLVVQLIPVVLYFFVMLMFWDRLPDTVAIHFSVRGTPDSYADRFSGAVIIPVVVMSVVPALTLLTSREPMLIRFPVYGQGQKAIFTLLTGLQIFTSALVTSALLYNAGIVSGGLTVWLAVGVTVFLLAWIGWMWRIYRIPEQYKAR